MLLEKLQGIEAGPLELRNYRPIIEDKAFPYISFLGPFAMDGMKRWGHSAATIHPPARKSSTFRFGKDGAAKRVFLVLALRPAFFFAQARGSSGAKRFVRHATGILRRILRQTGLTLLLVCLAGAYARAQGGPPYYTNDPGTPGHLNWEINLGYMPFLFHGQSVSHTPDVDINFGVGERIQLTYESAWLRVKNPGSPVEYGMNQSNPGVKWRFYDAGEDGLSISIFPQLLLNNPNDAVRRNIVAASETFLLPVEFSRKIGPLEVDFEAGYQFVHKGPDGWLTGLVVGHEFTKRFELDMELYAQGAFHPSFNQPTIDFGGRYKIHRPMILLFMAGRSLEPERNNQSYFLGYFGVQFLLPPKSYKVDTETDLTRER
jgi:hypothetical protein